MIWYPKTTSGKFVYWGIIFAIINLLMKSLCEPWFYNFWYFVEIYQSLLAGFFIIGAAAIAYYGSKKEARLARHIKRKSVSNLASCILDSASRRVRFNYDILSEKPIAKLEPFSLISYETILPDIGMLFPEEARYFILNFDHLRIQNEIINDVNMIIESRKMELVGKDSDGLVRLTQAQSEELNETLKNHVGLIGIRETYKKLFPVLRNLSNWLSCYAQTGKRLKRNYSEDLIKDSKEYLKIAQEDFGPFEMSKIVD